VALLLIFLALNAIVPTSELVRLTPRALRDLGVVVLIAITYVPETRRQLRRIREAQAIRGHKLRGIRDWRPIVVPLLISSLERSMRLSEAMVSRGYGATKSQESRGGERLLLISGLVLGFAGWLLILWRGWWGWPLLLVGLAFVGILIVRRSRSAPSTSYRMSKWRPDDIVMIVVSVTALLVVFLPWSIIDRTTLIYVPYPKVAPPEFDIIVGLALAAMAIPALVNLKSMVGDTAHDNV
jgi:energy-coupling factor transport system permease protein